MQLCSAVCGKVLKTSGNTTDLKIHLKQKHSVVLQHLTEEEKEVGEPKKRKGIFQRWWLVCESLLTNAEGLNIIIDKVRSIVVWFKRSVKASDQLRKVQIDAGTSEGNMKKIILDVKTRWNSTYYMLERFLQMLPMVSFFLFSDVKAPNMITAA
ncbi:hypothetical protein QE152_g7369 [Popillia japonica]|uniref:BED-type domain-containing protein n=1 Tax=Popillia japonica TaxID=7064 RepID=A0AAW1MBC1_POPJA